MGGATKQVKEMERLVNVLIEKGETLKKKCKKDLELDEKIREYQEKHAFCMNRMENIQYFSSYSKMNKEL